MKKITGEQLYMIMVPTLGVYYMKFNKEIYNDLAEKISRYFALTDKEIEKIVDKHRKKILFPGENAI